MWLGTKFKVLPNVLVFTLARFSFDYEKLDRIKLTNYFSFNLEYDFTYLVEDPVEK
jgi:ubiquitin carboxyl-terminal hydrolase 40